MLGEQSPALALLGSDLISSASQAHELGTQLLCPCRGAHQCQGEERLSRTVGHCQPWLLSACQDPRWNVVVASGFPSVDPV